MLGRQSFSVNASLNMLRKSAPFETEMRNMTNWMSCLFSRKLFEGLCLGAGGMDSSKTPTCGNLYEVKVPPRLVCGVRGSPRQGWRP